MYICVISGTSFDVSVRGKWYIWSQASTLHLLSMSQQSFKLDQWWRNLSGEQEEWNHTTLWALDNLPKICAEFLHTLASCFTKGMLCLKVVH